MERDVQTEGGTMIAGAIGATASSSSGSDVSAGTAPGPSPLQSIKIPTLFGGGSNVPIQESPKEDQQQSGRGTGYESGQVPEYSTVDRNSTSGQMNVSHNPVFCFQTGGRIC